MPQVMSESVLSLLAPGSGLSFLRALKALRTLRPLRTLNHVPQLQKCVIALFRSLAALLDIIAMYLLFLAMFAIMSVQVGHNSDAPRTVSPLPSQSPHHNPPTHLLKYPSAAVPPLHTALRRPRGRGAAARTRAHARERSMGWRGWRGWRGWLVIRHRRQPQHIARARDVMVVDGGRGRWRLGGGIDGIRSGP